MLDQFRDPSLGLKSENTQFPASSTLADRSIPSARKLLKL